MDAANVQFASLPPVGLLQCNWPFQIGVAAGGTHQPPAIISRVLILITQLMKHSARLPATGHPHATKVTNR
jgi:hypothetical protein